MLDIIPEPHIEVDIISDSDDTASEMGIPSMEIYDMDHSSQEQGKK